MRLSPISLSGTHSVKIVPILSGSFHEAIERGISPMELRTRPSVHRSSKNQYPPLEERFVILPALTSPIWVFSLEIERESESMISGSLTEEDQEMLEYAERMDGEGFFSSISGERDRRRICGLPAIYAMLKVLEAKRGQTPQIWSGLHSRDPIRRLLCQPRVLLN